MIGKVSIDTFDVNLFKEKWQNLQNTPKVFAYNLNVQQQRYLPGELYFYTEYNPERSSLRRAPQTITSLDPKYDGEEFNFNKVTPLEHLATIPHRDTEVVFLINKSPLTKYHCLICPDLKGCHGQRLTLDSLRFSIAFLLHLNDKAFRIGYNSPGALASVNHLHLHLLYIDVDLYIDRVKLEPLSSSTSIYRLNESMPTEAICCLIYRDDTQAVLEHKLNDVYDFIMWLCKYNRPHNLFITYERSPDNKDLIKIYIYARENYCFVKDLKDFNVGFCELSGYVPVGNAEVYGSLTEELVVTKIRNETGAVYEDIYSFLK